MRRGTAVSSVSVSIVLTVALWGSTSEAAKDGGQCRDAGATVVSDSVTLKCTRVGKKLKWLAEQSTSDTESTKPNVALPGSPFATWIDEMVTIVNMERSASGLNPLSECPALDQSAQLHSQDMNARDFFDHTNPDGKTHSDRIRLTGYLSKSKARGTGENIAAGFNDASSVMAAWMKSPGHRANILNSKFTHLGVGIASSRPDSSYGGYIWTQNFGFGGTC